MSPQVVLDIVIGGALLGAVYSLVAVGLNLAYGVTRILNVAHGDFLMIGAYLTYFSVTLIGLNPYTSILIVGPFMFLVGFLVYMLILRRVVKSSQSGEELEFRSLLLCFGLSFVIQNLAIVMWTANYRGYEVPSLGMVEVFGVSFEMNRVIIAAISVFINLLLYLFLRFTKAGIAMRATVDQPVGSQLVGMTSIVFVLFWSAGHPVGRVGRQSDKRRVFDHQPFYGRALYPYRPGPGDSGRRWEFQGQYRGRAADRLSLLYNVEGYRSRPHACGRLRGAYLGPLD